MNIRLANSEDYDAIWEIFHEVIQKGDTYTFYADTPKSDLQKHWFGPNMTTYLAELDGEIIGTYIIKPNNIDRSKHIGNCAYMVKGSAQGKGVGSKLCEHSIEVARAMGFLSIQFNKVVSTNKGAIRLWEKHGFKIVGTVPKRV